MNPSYSISEPYAYAFARNAYDFAEITIELRNVVRGDHIDSVFSSALVVRCYVAKTFETPYGVKLVFDPRSNGQVEMREMAAALKAMTSIAKKMNKMENELGFVSDRDLPEFARRVLVASGIRTVLYEPTFNHGAKNGNGLNLADGIFGLPKVDPRDGKDFLGIMRRLTDDTLRRHGMQKVEG
jgi:hypothetical protein